jgi:hypothetical protein
MALSSDIEDIRNELKSGRYVIEPVVSQAIILRFFKETESARPLVKT